MARACPICAEPVGGKDENEAYPFCSNRCRMIDLGNWLDGRYAVGDADQEGYRQEPVAGAPGGRKRGES